MAVTPPSFIQEAETAWNVKTSPKETSSFNVKKGDVLVALGIVEEASGRTLTIAGGSLTWTQRQVVTTASNTYVSVWTATVDADKSMAVSFSQTGSSALFGGNVLTFRGSSGVGKSAKTNAEGAPSLALSTEQEGSAIVAAAGDWNASDGTSRTWRTVNGITPSSGNGLEVTYFRDSAHYTTYGGQWSNAGTPGSKTTGVSSPSGQKYSIVAVEVKGEEKGGKALTLELSDSASFSESRGTGAARAQSDALALSEALARSSGLSRADAVAVAEALSRLSNLGRGDQVALADTLARAFGLSPADSITAADALTSRLTLSRTEQLGVEDLLAKAWQARREFDDIASVMDIQARTLAKQLLEGTVLEDLVQLDAHAYNVDELDLLDALEVGLRRILEDTLGLSESMAGSFGLSLSDGIALLDQVEGTGTAATALEDALNLNEQRHLAVGHLEAEVVAFEDSLAKSVGHAERDLVAFDDSLGRQISRSLSEALDLVDDLARKAAKFLADLLGLSDSTQAEGEDHGRPADLALSDVAATALALANRASTLLALDDRLAVADVGLADSPATNLVMEDSPA